MSKNPHPGVLFRLGRRVLRMAEAMPCATCADRKARRAKVYAIFKAVYARRFGDEGFPYSGFYVEAQDVLACLPDTPVRGWHECAIPYQPDAREQELLEIERYGE